MAAASLLTFPFPYSVYPHLDGLNISPHRINDAESRGARVLVPYPTRAPSMAGATDRMGDARFRTLDP
jgi:hypothetical protein